MPQLSTPADASTLACDMPHLVPAGTIMSYCNMVPNGYMDNVVSAEAERR